MSKPNPHSRPAAGSGIVYSTEGGRMCPECRQPIAQCQCAALRRQQERQQGDGVARVSRETKGRGGKAVTVVKGLALADDELSALGKRLKAACGSGGTVKDGVIEVQGDHVEKVMEALKKEGFGVKRVGG
jgi:translation initiation factor 1